MPFIDAKDRLASSSTEKVQKTPTLSTVVPEAQWQMQLYSEPFPEGLNVVGASIDVTINTFANVKS
jgi:hypothetical protein